MPRWSLLVAMTAPWLAWGVACGSDPQLPLEPSNPTGGVGGSVQGMGGDAQGGGGMGEGGTPIDAGVEPVRLGVVANTASSESGPAGRALAELTAFATGVRAISISIPWRNVDMQALDELSARVDSYVERDLSVVLELLVVDGTADQRPAHLVNAPWDDPAVQTDLEATIALVDGATLGDLTTVVLGRRTDAYVDKHPAEQAALTSLLTAGSLQLASLSLSHGVGLTFVGEETTTSYRGLAALGDRLCLAYLPGLGDSEIPNDVSHVKALDLMIDLAKERPVNLYAVGFPSAATLGSDGDQQAQQIDGFFDALDSRRAAFPIVIVQQLADFDSTTCDGVVLGQGLMPPDPLGDHLCSTGLRDEMDAPKPSWTRFVHAAAHFATP